MTEKVLEVTWKAGNRRKAVPGPRWRPFGRGGLIAVLFLALVLGAIPVSRAALGGGAGDEAAPGQPQGGCGACSDDMDCCQTKYFNFVRNCHSEFGKTGLHPDPEGMTQCMQSASEYLMKCMDIIDPQGEDCREAPHGPRDDPDGIIGG